jgi:hypothetical protein
MATSQKWGKTKITFASNSKDDDRALTLKFKIPKKWRTGPVLKVKTTFLESFNTKFPTNLIKVDSCHLQNSQAKDLADTDIVQDVISTHDTLTFCLGPPPVRKTPKLYHGHKVDSGLTPANAGTTSTKSSGFNYNRFDNIDVSDEDEDRAECHPNIDVKSWIRLRKNQREENRAKERAEIAALEATVDELKQRSVKLEEAAQRARDDSEANAEEIDEAESVARDVAHQLHDAEYELSERIRKKKLTVDELCQDGFDVTSSAGTDDAGNPDAPSSSGGGSLAFPDRAVGTAPGNAPPKGQAGPSVPEDLGYDEYLSKHQSVIDVFGESSVDIVCLGSLCMCVLTNAWEIELTCIYYIFLLFFFLFSFAVSLLSLFLSLFLSFFLFFFPVSLSSHSTPQHCRSQVVRQGKKISAGQSCHSELSRSRLHAPTVFGLHDGRPRGNGVPHCNAVPAGAILFGFSIVITPRPKECRPPLIQKN